MTSLQLSASDTESTKHLLDWIILHTHILQCVHILVEFAHNATGTSVLDSRTVMSVLKGTKEVRERSLRDHKDLQILALESAD